MKLELKELQKSDYRKALQFAITGMHFNLYLQHSLLLHLYGKYFFYSSLNRATQAVGAYIAGEFVGVLLADVKGEGKLYHNFRKTVYVKIFEIAQNIVEKNSAGIYDKANQEMFGHYFKNKAPEVEILFLAADPNVKMKGIGSALLTELEQREKGKQIYLYTDNACTYQFYEHRGFSRVGEKDIVLDLSAKRVPLTCLLYNKKL